MRKIWLYLSLITMLASLPAFPLFAERRVRNSERLDLVRQATSGTPSSSSSFQSRLDAMLDVSSSAERTYVATQEQAKIQEQQNQDAALDSFYFSTGVPADKDFEEDYKKEKEEEKAGGPVKIEGKLEGQKVQSGELDFQEQHYEDLQQIRQQRAGELLELEQALPEEEPGEKQTSNLRPSLAHNPFYFQPISDAEIFETRKSEIISRLVREGYSANDANELVMTSTSQDELIIRLMEEDDYTFGDAMRVSS